MDQLLAMRVFNKVADRGSFARAADELELSRAAASSHVAALEKHLGVRLAAPDHAARQPDRGRHRIPGPQPAPARRLARCRGEPARRALAPQGQAARGRSRRLRPLSVAAGVARIHAPLSVDRTGPAAERSHRRPRRRRCRRRVAGRAAANLERRRPTREPDEYRHVRLTGVHRRAWRAAYPGRPAGSTGCSA